MRVPYILNKFCARYSCTFRNYSIFYSNFKKNLYLKIKLYGRHSNCEVVSSTRINSHFLSFEKKRLMTVKVPVFNTNTSSTYTNLTNVNTDYNLKSTAVLSKQSITTHMIIQAKSHKHERNIVLLLVVTTLRPITCATYLSILSIPPTAYRPVIGW